MRYTGGTYCIFFFLNQERVQISSHRAMKRTSSICRTFLFVYLLKQLPELAKPIPPITRSRPAVSLCAGISWIKSEFKHFYPGRLNILNRTGKSGYQDFILVENHLRAPGIFIFQLNDLFSFHLSLLITEMKTFIEQKLLV